MKTDHDFWHKKVRYKIDPKILSVDNFFLLPFSCWWIDLSHLAYKPEYFLETNGQ